MRELRSVPQDKVFYISEGGTIGSIYQLAESLSSISAKSFRHHVSSGKNDFASWVRDVLDDTSLAAKLSGQKTKAQMEKAVWERIKELEHEHMPAHASRSILRSGIVDFLIGLIIGLVAGIIVASFL